MAEQRSKQGRPEYQERVGTQASGQGMEADDCYVLYRTAGTARYPFLGAWIMRHRLSAGFRARHAARFRRVLVIGPPDGLALPPDCRVAYVHAEDAEARLAADPHPNELF